MLRGFARLRLVISKPVSHNEVKLKEKPDTVEFNPLYALLCDLNVKKRYAPGPVLSDR